MPDKFQKLRFMLQRCNTSVPTEDLVEIYDIVNSLEERLLNLEHENTRLAEHAAVLRHSRDTCSNKIRHLEQGLSSDSLANALFRILMLPTDDAVYFADKAHEIADDAVASLEFPKIPTHDVTVQMEFLEYRRMVSKEISNYQRDIELLRSKAKHLMDSLDNSQPRMLLEHAIMSTSDPRKI